MIKFNKFCIVTTRFFFLSIFCFVSPVNAKPYVMVTVDVESISSISMSEQFELSYEGVKFGLDEMLNILNKNSIQGVFFFNVYEYMKEQNDSVKKIAQIIDQRGHDIELHTHPQWGYDRQKNYMHNYSLKEQIRIIREGKNLLEKWTGKKIIAHRAGAYGADLNTLKAIEENNIFMDSSFYYQHPWCKLNTSENKFKKNNYSQFGKVTQIPVNVFYLDDVPAMFNTLKPIRYVTKYDINAYVEENILIQAIDAAVEADFDVIVLFLHSFTFIKGSNGNYRPMIDEINKFKKVLKYLKGKNLTFLTFKDLEKTRQQYGLMSDKDDIMPSIRREISTIKYFLKGLGIKTKQQAVRAIVIIIVFFGMIATVSIFVIHRQKRKGLIC